MKKLIFFILFVMSLNIYGIDVFGPKAPPTIGFLRDNSIELYLYQDASTEVIPKIIKGREGIYILPMNLGATLYNKGVDIKLMASMTNGLLSLVSTEVDSFKELEGKDLYIGGMGASPDVVTRSLLTRNNIDVEIKYRTSQEIARLIISGRIKNAILPEPLATLVTSKNSKVQRVVQLKELWPNKKIPQVGIFIVGDDKQLKSRVDVVLDSYKMKVNNFTNEDIDLTIKEFKLPMDRREVYNSVEYMNLTYDRDKVAIKEYLKVLKIETNGDFYGW